MVERASYLNSLDGNRKFDGAIIVGQFSLQSQVSAHAAAGWKEGWGYLAG